MAQSARIRAGLPRRRRALAGLCGFVVAPRGGGGCIAPAWLADSRSWLLSGQPWRSPDPANLLCPGRFESLSQQPVATASALLTGALLCAPGIVVFAMHSRETRWLLAAMLLPLGGLFLQAVFTGNLLMSWYACPALPAIAVLMGASATFVTRRTLFPWLALMGLNLFAGHEMRSLLRHHELEPNRAATALTRPILNPAHPDYLNDKSPITIQFSCRRPGYEPACREIATAGELVTLRQEALQSGRDCYVNLGDAGAAAQRWPDILALLNDPTLFRRTATLPGMDHAQTRVIWQAVR